MDDSLELPSATPFQNIPVHQPEDEDEQSSGDEDAGLDWAKLQFGVLRPVIPKRGEKEYEPAPGGGSSLQSHVLDRARQAMFNALRATRSTSSKHISYGIWSPDISRVYITMARGMHFPVMGHSAPRPSTIKGQMGKLHKRLELLPEEAIYLIERGALFCCKAGHESISGVSGMEDLEGSPMSVQQAYTEMIGTEHLTLEKYQVFAYLKRLGYVVTRAVPPSPSYPISQAIQKAPPRSSFVHRLVSRISTWLPLFCRWFSRGLDWWQPVQFSRWIHHDKNYKFLFKSLRFIPSGHQIPLPSTAPSPPSPYTIFYHLYKPSTAFRKSAPPSPDFSVVVIDARKTPMPSLYELHALFDNLPEVPPPLPRQKPQVATKPTLEAIAPVPDSSHNRPNLLQRIFSWIPLSPTSTQPQVRKPNPFAALKAGKKNIVIAAVDAGNISFFRFNQGAFSDWPMV